MALNNDPLFSCHRMLQSSHSCIGCMVAFEVPTRQIPIPSVPRPAGDGGGVSAGDALAWDACVSVDASGTNRHRTATNVRTEKKPQHHLDCTIVSDGQAYNLACCFPHTQRNISGIRWEPEPWAPSCEANKQLFGAMHHFRSNNIYR